MREYLDSNDEPYSQIYMKQKLMDHHVDKVSFHEVSGIETIVILQRKAEKIIDKFYKDLRKESVEEEKLKIIQTAAQLIWDKFKSVKEVYVKLPNS